MNITKPKVALIMGSDSDYPVLAVCIGTLQKFGIEVDVQIISAHRTPDKAADYAKNAEKNGFEVIIAAAGKAAHLPGILAAHTILPVIGIPIKTPSVEGMDALLSIVQMPPGVPVAAVALDGALNAALLAVQILSLKHVELKEDLRQYKADMARKVDEKNNELQKKLKKETGEVKYNNR